MQRPVVISYVVFAAIMILVAALGLSTPFGKPNVVLLMASPWNWPSV